MSSPLIHIQGVTQRFLGKDSAALEKIEATLPRGKIIGLVGPDGAGKTTLIRLLAGLLVPTEGKILVDGIDTVQEMQLLHVFTGYMPQKFGLYEELTVQQNLDLYADLRGVSHEERTETFSKLLHFTGLSPFIHRLAGALSGGMKQKLGLACALIKKPRLLLLDEPSVGVDPLSRRELWGMVRSLLAEGITIIWSTAYLDEAEQCDTVLLLSGGKLLYQGPPHQLTERVEGRVFHLAAKEEERRRLLFELLNIPGILDGVIQGREIRILLSKDASPPDRFALQPTAPRFEDAFIDLLGGGPGGRSVLAEKTPSLAANSHFPIVAERLTKRFGHFTAVDQVSFEVKKGEIFGLLGPNGAGKSTTFKMLCGLLNPTAGKASVNGLNLQEAPGQARSHIGYMAQKFSLYGNLSVKQNLDFFSGIYNLSGAAKRSAIEEMVEIFHLKPYLSASADGLPLGFKQRLALACANMHHPEVLFLDEPTSGVDPLTRREFWNHINGLVEKGVTIIVTTHFMDEAEYCDRIALIYRGQIIAMQTPDGLKEQVRSEALPNPTLEDAFVKRIEEYDRAHPT